MEIIEQLPELIKNGVIVSVICTALFLIFTKPLSKWKSIIKDVVMKLIVVGMAFIWVWLSSTKKLAEIQKQDVAEWILTIAFAVVFYEFAGKYIVRKWFKNYRAKQINAGA